MPLPPEVCGCLHHAQRHLKLSKRFVSPEYRRKKNHHKQMNKVQKLVERAVRILNKRKVVLNGNLI